MEIQKKITVLSENLNNLSLALEDFRDQIQQMNNLGGLGKMLEKLPISSSMKEGAQEKIERNKFGQMIVIIDSMTPKERHLSLIHI